MDQAKARSAASASSTRSTAITRAPSIACFGLLAAGTSIVREPELGGLANALLAALHRPDFPRQPDFTKYNRFGWQWPVFQ